jgi:hypothetical protein
VTECSVAGAVVGFLVYGLTFIVGNHCLLRID